MPTIIDKKGNIEHTRGDVLPLDITFTNEDETDYVFKKGDVVRFKVFKKKDCNCVEIQKDVVVETETTIVPIDLTKEDTKIGELINKPVEYWYEVELNPDTAPQTPIGYTVSEGAKLFVLTPEGADKRD